MRRKFDLSSAGLTAAETFGEYMVWHWQTLVGARPARLWLRVALLVLLPFGPACGLGCALGAFIHEILSFILHDN